MAHTTSASGLPSLGLLAPIVCDNIVSPNPSIAQSRASPELEVLAI